MAGIPVAQAAGRGATLSGDVVGREAVEAETHKLWRDGAMAFGCHTPRTASLTTTRDHLESISIDIGPSTGLPSHVRHGRPTPRAESLVHRNTRRWPWTKVTLHMHTRDAQWLSPTAIGHSGPVLMTPLPPCRHRPGALHSATRHDRSPCRQWRRGLESLAGSVQVRQARGRFVVGATCTRVFLPTPELTPAS
jgi:hypothetical protein